MVKTLAIVGAGAKAAAIVARAAVLRDLLKAKQAPEILVFEENQIGCAWSGAGSFSSGFLELCTPGEKDVGFPYSEVASRGMSKPLAPELHARFSWSAFLVSQGEFSNWVDRGRQFPTHRHFSEYLEWVFSEAGQDVIYERVTKITPRGSRWRVHYTEKGTAKTKEVDGVVLTGNGTARTVPLAGGIPDKKVFSAESFWADRDEVTSLVEGTVAVAGSGGAAGTIIAWLAGVFAEREVTVTNISPMGTLFLRGDGHAERRWFSDPSDWPKLSLEDRRYIVERTDAGVISQRNKALIDRSENIEYARGRISTVAWDVDELKIEVGYGKELKAVKADFLINAIGFDGWSLLDLIHHPQTRKIRDRDKGAALRRKIEQFMLSDLSLPKVADLGKGIHVPGLAAIRRGPGLGSLGSLGLMARAILQPYIK